MAPVTTALEARGLSLRVILTGQQRIDPHEFGFARFDHATLNCPGRTHPHWHARAVAQALRPFVTDTGMVIVHGDTSSAMGGALAAARAGIPLAHVEAGLRTYDRCQPWPEEVYRTAIDARADILFAPTMGAARNLESEGLRGRIVVTGNSGIDALLALEAALPPPSVRERDGLRLLVTCHRRENWGAGARDVAAALVSLAERGDVRITCILHSNPNVAEPLRQALGNRAGITLVPPCSHIELVTRMREANLILSDSGGIQEEAPALGVATLVLRERTERPEAIATGNARLVGTSRDGIIAEVERLIADPLALAAMSRRAFPFGDGRASARIAAALLDWLDERRTGESRAVGA